MSSGRCYSSTRTFCTPRNQGAKTVHHRFGEGDISLVGRRRGRRNGSRRKK